MDTRRRGLASVRAGLDFQFSVSYVVCTHLSFTVDLGAFLSFRINAFMMLAPQTCLSFPCSRDAASLRNVYYAYMVLITLAPITLRSLIAPFPPPPLTAPLWKLAPR